MGKLLQRRWPATLGGGLSRRAGQGCTYEAYLPDRLADRRLRLDGEVAADVADAETALRELNAHVVALAETEALARLLLRAESVASSYIEGLVVGGRRLLRAEAARSLGETSGDVTAEEVLGNIDATSWAVEELSTAPTVTVGGLRELHRRLLVGTRLADHAGRVRTEQNWIGGNSFNPCAAAFVPPPHEHVEDLLSDLCSFLSGDSLPAIAQAAVAHAQFETIHPFVDGNGRAGRALIHVVLRRRGLAPRMLAPISLVLASWSTSYVEGLTATRHVGRPNTALAHEGFNQWIAFFAAAGRRAVTDATAFERRIEDITSHWRTSLGQVRAGSTVELLLSALTGAPIVSVTSAAALVGRSFQATNEGMHRLEAAGVVHQVKLGRRNRAYETSAIIDAFTALERQLASPSGDTRIAAPQRAVPARPVQ